jgi:hypothetical protein
LSCSRLSIDSFMGGKRNPLRMDRLRPCLSNYKHSRYIKMHTHKQNDW